MKRASTVHSTSVCAPPPASPPPPSTPALLRSPNHWSSPPSAVQPPACRESSRPSRKSGRCVDARKAPMSSARSAKRRTRTGWGSGTIRVTAIAIVPSHALTSAGSMRSNQSSTSAPHFPKRPSGRSKICARSAISKAYAYAAAGSTPQRANAAASAPAEQPHSYILFEGRTAPSASGRRRSATRRRCRRPGRGACLCSPVFVGDLRAGDAARRGIGDGQVVVHGGRSAEL